MFRVCSEYVQGMFRVCSEYSQSIFRVYSEYVMVCFISSSSASSVSVFGIFQYRAGLGWVLKKKLGSGRVQVGKEC